MENSRGGSNIFADHDPKLLSRVLLGENGIHCTCQHSLSLSLILSSQAHSRNLSFLTSCDTLTHSDFLCFVSSIHILFSTTTLSSLFHLVLCDCHYAPIVSLPQYIAYHTQSCCCYPALMLIYRVDKLCPCCTFTLYIFFSLAG